MDALVGYGSDSDEEEAATSERAYENATDGKVDGSSEDVVKEMVVRKLSKRSRDDAVSKGGDEEGEKTQKRVNPEPRALNHEPKAPNTES
jgi:hypothetical protein